MFSVERPINIKFNYTAVTVALIIIFSSISIFGSPFIYDQVNSGRQLTVTLKNIDTELFADDYIVAAFGLYRSLFYDGLSVLANVLGIEAIRLESLVYMLYLVSRFVIVAAFFYLAKVINENRWLFILLAAWSCHPKSVPVGGPGGGAWMFQPLLTHNDVALIILIFSLYHLLRNNFLAFSTLVSIALFVHSLYALHFTLCVIPFLLSEKSINKFHFIGIALFVSCCFLYFTLYATPEMSQEERNIFLSIEGASGHISLLSQKPILWAKLILLSAVTILAHLNFTRGNKRLDHLNRSAIFGFASGILLSAIAIISKSLMLSLFQPMRMMLWVTLFFHIVLANSAVEAFKQSMTFGLILCGVLWLTVIYSPWTMVISSIGSLFLLARLILRAWWNQHISKLELLLKSALIIISIFFILTWSIKELQFLDSLASSALILLSLLCLITLAAKYYRLNITPAIAIASIFIALSLASVDRHEYYRKAFNGDWIAVRRWSQANTAKSDRFITPPEENTFRSLSLRTSVSERNIEVVWGSPKSYLKNKADADQAAEGYRDDFCDLEYLFRLAQKWGCSYVVSKGRVLAKDKPVYQSGIYGVFKVPEADNVRGSHEKRT